jgi:hypothetical protein
VLFLPFRAVTWLEYQGGGGPMVRKYSPCSYFLEDIVNNWNYLFHKSSVKPGGLSALFFEVLLIIHY